MEPERIRRVLEAALFAAGRPLSLEVLQDLFQEEGGPPPSRDLLRQSLQDLAGEYATRAVQLREVASGYRFQVSPEYARWVARLWAERPARYSRALLETLAIIAYRQPVTRAEVEDIRGVQVSTSVLKTLLERAWVRVVGHRDVPGRPALYGTTREFLDHFNLKTLAELPTLAEVRELDALGRDLFAPATEPAAE